MLKRSIGIDCRLGGIAHAGIGRYIVELVSRVVTHNQTVDWVLFCTDKAQAKELIGETVPDHVKIIFTPIRQYTLAEQLVLPGIFYQANLDLLHVPHFNVPFLYRKPFVVTIHDLLWHEYKGMDVTTLSPLLYWPKYLAYRSIASNAIQKAHTIFVPTYTVKATILRYYPRAEKKITVTKEGIGQALATLSQTGSTRKRKEFELLYVGSLYPHKNVSLVLRALQRLPEYRLNIVGARSVFQEKLEAEVHELHLDGQVTFLGKLSDSELARQYQECSVLIQPSVSEGFGLTGLEGLAFQTPLLASDIPIFHEVYQDAAEYFDKESVDSCIAALRKLENSETLTALAKHSKQVTKQYSWDTLAQQTLDGYEQALAE